MTDIRLTFKDEAGQTFGEQYELLNTTPFEFSYALRCLAEQLDRTIRDRNIYSIQDFKVETIPEYRYTRFTDRGDYFHHQDYQPDGVYGAVTARRLQEMMKQCLGDRAPKENPKKELI